MTFPPMIGRRFARVFLAMAVVASVLPLAALPAHAAANTAVQLDGVDDAITLGAGGGSPLGATNFTLELWFKRTGTGSVASTGSGGATSVIPLITKGRSQSDGSNVDANYFLGINTTTTGGPSTTIPNTLAADFEDTASGANHPVFGTTVITMNVWHHAAATFSGSQFCLYLDGVLDGSCVATTAVPRSDSIQIPAIGTAYDAQTPPVTAGRFAGQVDEARIWSVARSQAQIQSAMNTEIVSPVAGLLGRWGMNEGTGITAANTAGSAGVNGTLVGPTGGLPTWVNGPTFDAPPLSGNSAVQLDGVDDAITLGAGGGSPLGATNFTLELWFKRTGTGSVASTGSGGATSVIPLITKGRSQSDGSNVDANYFLGINTTTTGGPSTTIPNTLAADFEDTASGANHPVFGTTVITMNVWHHAAATFSGSQFCLYLDGVLDGSCVATTAVPRSDSIQIPAIGTAYDAQTPPVTAGRFAGQVDEARIWSVARSQAQIQSAMNTEIVSPVAGLLGRWGMNEGTGITAANTAGSAGVNGTLVGPTGGLPTWVNGAGSVETPPPGGNYGVQFDGTNDYVTFGTAPGLGATTFTLETWFKRTGTGVPVSTGTGGVNAIPLITKGRHDADGSNLDMNYFLGIDQSTGTLVGDFEDLRTTNNNNPVFGATPITQNVWHHAAATFSGTQFCLYLDGTLDGTCLATSQTPRSDSIEHAGLGTGMESTGVAEGFFAGVMDEVRIWGVARTEAQIQAAMGAEITTGQPNLLGRWGLNEGFWTNAGGTGTTVNGTLTNGPTWLAGTTFTPPNRAPLVDSVVINQASPHTDDTLSATVTSHDPDGDPLTTSYQWTVNGSDIGGATGATLSLSAVGDRGDAIRVRVTVSDGSDTSAPLTSAPVTVLNSAPTATVSLDDHSPGTNATLTATATTDDADDDSVTLTYVWKVDGVTRQTTPAAGLSDTFELSLTGNGDNGQTVTVTATPNDGTADGAPASDSATVGNAVPLVDSVVINQASPHTDDTLSATVTSHDPDGDPLTTSYQWTVNGSDIGGATGATLSLSAVGDRGDAIRVRVTVSDGSDTSAPLTSAPVTVLNSAPTATVSLDDHSPGTNATLTATATTDDADDDSVTLTYVWKVDGVTRQTTPAAGLSDTFELSLTGNGDNGQTVTVTATPNDGTADGAPASDSATVGNAVPLVDSVVINQASPHTDDTLSATVTSHDPDGDPLTTSYQWTVNGSDIGGATGATLSLSAVGDRGDAIRVRVTVSDGSDTSAPLTSAPVTVLNSAPTATVSLDDHSPGTNATLTATATTDDADDDSVTLTYVWKVDGVTRQTTPAAGLSDTFELSLTGNGDNGQTVTVTATPNDGTADGAPASDSATVGNAVPLVDSVVINQASPHTDDTLSATVTSHDPDGDPLTTSYQWTVNGSDIGGATGATLSLSAVGDRGDAIRVRVTVSDGSDTSAPLTSAPVTVLNSAPTATVSLDDHSPGTNATLTATATTDDADDDSVTLTYVWKVDGVTRQTTPAAGLSDTFELSLTGNGDNGQTVTVTATPNDGTADGAPASDSATVSSGAIPPIFSDDFSSGNFSNWTGNTNLTIDNATGSPAAPSARAQASGQAAWAYRTLPSTAMTVCASVRINVTSATGAIDLFRLRTAANGAVIKVVRLATGNLQIRSDFGSTTINSGVALGTGFHDVELCGTVGTTSSWDLYRDGVKIVDAWGADTGTSPVGRIQIGDTVAKTFTVNFDHVVVDQVPGENQAPDTSPPTVPGTPSGSSPSTGNIQIGWAASTDDTPPITYRIYRDGNPTPIGQTTATTYLDSGLTPGSSHTYTVDAVDALAHPSAMSPASASILVSSGAIPPIFSDDFSSGNFSNWTGNTNLTIDNATGSPAAPSARAQASGQAAWAYRTLPSTAMTVCASVRINVTSATGAIDLFRLRTAANGAVIKVVRLATGNLQIRSDFGSTTINSGVALGTGFHDVELCGTVGTTSSWDLYRDGVKIVDAWGADTGTSPVGRIQIGDTVAKTFTVNFDHVVVDQVVGG